MGRTADRSPRVREGWPYISLSSAIEKNGITRDDQVVQHTDVDQRKRLREGHGPVTGRDCLRPEDGRSQCKRARLDDGRRSKRASYAGLSREHGVTS